MGGVLICVWWMCGGGVDDINIYAHGVVWGVDDVLCDAVTTVSTLLINIVRVWGGVGMLMMLRPCQSVCPSVSQVIIKDASTHPPIHTPIHSPPPPHQKKQLNPPTHTPPPKNKHQPTHTHTHRVFPSCTSALAWASPRLYVTRSGRLSRLERPSARASARRREERMNSWFVVRFGWGGVVFGWGGGGWG